MPATVTRAFIASAICVAQTGFADTLLPAVTVTATQLIGSFKVDLSPVTLRKKIAECVSSLLKQQKQGRNNPNMCVTICLYIDSPVTLVRKCTNT